MPTLYAGLGETAAYAAVILIAAGITLVITPAPEHDRRRRLARRRNFWRYLLGWPAIPAPGRGTAAVESLHRDGIIVWPGYDVEARMAADPILRDFHRLIAAQTRDLTIERLTAARIEADVFTPVASPTWVDVEQFADEAADRAEAAR